MTLSTTLQTVGGTNAVALPTDYLNLRSIKIVSGSTECELTYNTSSALDILGSGMPQYFTIEGSNLTFDYTPDGVYDLEVSYFARPAILDETNDTNAILTNYPDIYMWACMSMVYVFATEPELVQAYKVMMVDSIRGAMKADGKGLRPNAAMRNRGLTP